MIYYQTITEDKYSIYDYISLNLNIFNDSVRNIHIIRYTAGMVYLRDLKDYTKENSSEYPDTFYKVLKIKE